MGTEQQQELKLEKTRIYKFLKTRKYIRKWSGINSHIFIKK